ncbi:hypothetical protein SprV_1002907800 [Sparganum proliferum]
MAGIRAVRSRNLITDVGRWCDDRSIILLIDPGAENSVCQCAPRVAKYSAYENSQLCSFRSASFNNRMKTTIWEWPNGASEKQQTSVKHASMLSIHAA